MMTDPFTAPAQMLGPSFHHITSMSVPVLQAHTSQPQLVQRSFHTPVGCQDVTSPHGFGTVSMLVEETRIVGAGDAQVARCGVCRGADSAPYWCSQS